MPYKWCFTTAFKTAVEGLKKSFLSLALSLSLFLPCCVQGLGLMWVQGLGFGVWVLGFRV